MGWNWSLWFCQDALAHQMTLSERRRTRRSYEEVGRQLVRDRAECPRLQPGVVCLAPYVDNANIIAWNAAESIEALNALRAQLDSVGLLYREETRGKREMESVGLVLDGRRREVRNTVKRAWRLRIGLSELLKQGACSGYTLRVVIGHLVHFFMPRKMCPCLVVCALGVRGGPQRRTRPCSPRRSGMSCSFVVGFLGSFDTRQVRSLLA